MNNRTMRNNGNLLLLVPLVLLLVAAVYLGRNAAGSSGCPTDNFYRGFNLLPRAQNTDIQPEVSAEQLLSSKGVENEGAGVPVENIAQEQSIPPVATPTKVPFPTNPGVLYSLSVDDNRRVIGRDGQTGIPLPVENLQANIVDICGSGHSLAVTANGEVFSWGRNDSAGGGGGGSKSVPDSGQLGAARDGTDLNKPGKLLNTGPSGVFIVSVACGRYHSVALDREGRVYTWGLNDFTQLGRKARDSDENDCHNGQICRSGVFGEVDWGQSSKPPKIISIDAGRYHTTAVSDQGKVFTWGLNFCAHPNIVETAEESGKYLHDFSFKEAMPMGGAIGEAQIESVDSGYVFWTALDSNGGVWTCNTGSDGYAGELAEVRERGGFRKPNKEGELGHVTEPGPLGLMPARVDLPAVEQVVAGRCFGLARTAEGHVYSWGCYVFGSKTGPVKLPDLGPDSKYGPATFLAAGEYHAHIVTEGGKLLIIGRTGREQYGDDIPTPKPVKGAETLNVSTVKCGHQHSLLASVETMNQEHLQQGSPAQQGYSPILRTTPDAFGAVHSVPRIHSAFVGNYTPPDKQQVQKAAQDAFDSVSSFEEKYKNPCFVEAARGRLRCLPYFSIIGVSKCGTTDLYKKLEKFRFFMGSINKGPHFWDEDHPWKWYLDVFDNVAEKLEKDPDAAQLVTSDASSNTFTYSGVGIRGNKNTEVLLPEVLKEIQPGMKVIVMLRDPVERLYSAFWYYGCMYGLYQEFGMSPQGFHLYAEHSIQEMKQCMEKESLSARYCAVKNFNVVQQIVKGMYSVFLPDWLAIYPKDMIMVIRLEDLASSPRSTLEETVKFLQLPDPDAAEYDAALSIEANRGHFQNPAISGCDAVHGPMLNETRKILQDFYEPFNHHLAELLSNSNFTWGY